ncbi:MAG: hypothetical protein J6U72_00815 [Clostridia bacterium]|nr:hypothetical protein [Clostridia bacterium]
MKARLSPRLKALIGAALTLLALWGGKELAKLLVGSRFTDSVDPGNLTRTARQVYLYFESVTSVMAYMLGLTVCLFVRDPIGKDSRRTNKRLLVLLPAGVMLGAGLVKLLIDLDVIRREPANIEAGAYLALILIPLRCCLRELLCRNVLQKGLSGKNSILALAASVPVSALMYVLIPGRLSTTGAANGLLLGLVGALVYDKTGSVLPMALLSSGFGLGVSLDGFINKSSLYRVGDEIFSGNLSLIYDGLGLTLILAAMLALTIISKRPKKKTRT